MTQTRHRHPQRGDRVRVSAGCGARALARYGDRVGSVVSIHVEMLPNPRGADDAPPKRYVEYGVAWGAVPTDIGKTATESWFHVHELEVVGDA